MKTLPIYAAAIALLSGVGAANGADVYSPGSTKDPATGIPASTVNWGGFYGGVNIGYGWGDRGATDFSFYDLKGNLKETDKAALGSYSTSGVVGGAQIGYLLQKGNLVGGLEASFNGSGIYGDKGRTWTYTDENDSVYTDKGKIQQSVKWYGTVGPKIGFALDHILISGTGGFAYGGVEDKFSVSSSGVDANGDAIASASHSDSWKSDSVRTGWFVGAEVEYKVNNWGVFGGYQHVDLGSHGITGTIFDHDVTPAAARGTLSTSSIKTEFDVVKVGINYHTN